MFTSAKTKH